MYKNFEEYRYLDLEEEVYFILWPSLRVPFSSTTDASSVSFMFFNLGQWFL
jgi:hypothetical protein